VSVSTAGTRPSVAGPGAGAPVGPVLRRRVSTARVLLGVLLVLCLALAGVVVARRVDARVAVLAAAHAIGAGQTLGAGDVVTVLVAADAGLATVPAAQASSVVGRVVAVPLAAGTLLAPNQFGGPVWPGAGEAVIAVPVKAGRLPSGLAAGAHVSVLVLPSGTPGTTAGAGSGGQAVVDSAAAVVVSVQATGDQSGTTVVTLVLGVGDATRVASGGGDVVLVQLGG